MLSLFPVIPGGFSLYLFDCVVRYNACFYLWFVSTPPHFFFFPFVVVVVGSFAFIVLPGTASIMAALSLNVAPVLTCPFQRTPT